MRKYKFIDLFAGIGGFHHAFHELGAECVFASEIDSYARKSYEHNLKNISPVLFASNKFNDDILKISHDSIDKEIPDFDILCAGFPCQPFSQAGFKRGFTEEKDSRGDMFFKITDIIRIKRPKAFFLENVRHLLKHNEGNTFKVIKETLEALGYSFHAKIIRASDHGLPQHRARLFMIGFSGETSEQSIFEFPDKEILKITMSDIFGGICNKKIGYTIRVGGRSSGIKDRRNWDTYIINGEEKRITSKEAKKMMGFRSDFVFPVSETQALKQLGNSVAIPAIIATAKQLINYLSHVSKPRECNMRQP